MQIGSYQVLSQISEGAFGRTFKGRHVLLGELACLKQEKTGQPAFQKLFRHEAKLLWGLHHVSLPTVKDYFEHPDFQQVLVMSYITGQSLADIVQNGFIADEHICWILQRLLDALSYLHHHGLVHCDIKPQNIILNTKEHNAVLVDFGLCLAQSGTAKPACGGTEFYLPPEFLLGLPPMPQSDLYSLGLTTLAVSGGNVATATFPPDMHPRLVQFLSQLIRRDPLARPSSASQLNSELTQLRRAMFGRTNTLTEFEYRGGQL